MLSEMLLKMLLWWGALFFGFFLICSSTYDLRIQVIQADPVTETHRKLWLCYHGIGWSSFVSRVLHNKEISQLLTVDVINILAELLLKSFEPSSEQCSDMVSEMVLDNVCYCLHLDLNSFQLQQF